MEIDIYFGFQYHLVEKISKGSFVSQVCHDILTYAIGTKEHHDHVHIVGFGVGVRQYFGSASHLNPPPGYVRE